MDAAAHQPTSARRHRRAPAPSRRCRAERPARPRSAGGGPVGVTGQRLHPRAPCPRGSPCGCSWRRSGAGRPPRSRPRPPARSARRAPRGRRASRNLRIGRCRRSERARGGSTTAATTTGPASGPRPASSIPATTWQYRDVPVQGAGPIPIPTRTSTGLRPSVARGDAAFSTARSASLSGSVKKPCFWLCEDSVTDVQSGNRTRRRPISRHGRGLSDGGRPMLRNDVLPCSGDAIRRRARGLGAAGGFQVAAHAPPHGGNSPYAEDRASASDFSPAAPPRPGPRSAPLPGRSALQRLARPEAPAQWNPIAAVECATGRTSRFARTMRSCAGSRQFLSEPQRHKPASARGSDRRVVSRE